MGARLRRKLVAHLRDPVYSNGYALVLNAGVGAALGLLFWMVAARRFDAADLGWGAAVVSAATLAALIGKAGFDAALIRFAPTAPQRYVRKLVLYACAAAAALTGAVCLAILALAGSGLGSLSPLRTPLAAAGFLLLACGTAVAWILDAYYISEQAAVVTLARNVAFHGIKLFVPLLVVAALASYAVPISFAVGLAASLAVSLALLPRRLRRERQGAAERVSRADVVGYSAKNYVLNLSEFLPGLVLPLLVLETLGAQANAGFFLAWTAASVAFLASKAIAQSAFAQLVRDASPASAVAKGAKLSLIVLLPATLALFAGAEIVLGLFGEAYVGSAALLRILALSVPAIALTNLYLAYLKAHRPGWELTALPAVSLAALLVALPVALGLSGIVGVGLVWLGVQLAVATWSGARLAIALRRTSHAARTPLDRRPHQG